MRYVKRWMRLCRDRGVLPYVAEGKYWNFGIVVEIDDIQRPLLLGQAFTAEYAFEEAVDEFNRVAREVSKRSIESALIKELT